jgi:excisionase family DNA binding protein
MDMSQFSMSPQEIVEKKTLLRVDEAAYCLNVSERTIYEWTAVGILRKLKMRPVRIPSEDVLALMNDFNE